MKYNIRVPDEIPDWFKDYEKVVPPKSIDNFSSADNTLRQRIFEYINKYENTKFEIIHSKDRFSAKIYDSDLFLTEINFPYSYTKENIMLFFEKILEEVKHCEMLTEKNKYKSWHKYYINKITNN